MNHLRILISLFKKEILIIIFIALLIHLSKLPEPLFLYNSSTLVLDKNKSLLRAYLNDDEQYQFIDHSLKIPSKLKQAIIQYEDEYFYYHLGVNPVAIARALWQNIKESEIVSGASTITMQVMRLSRKRPRTYFNKFIESLQAIRFDLLYKKEEVLKIYANNAPYGGNIIGFYAASMKYFGKRPDQLSWAESALLAVLPNAPGLLRPGKNNHLLLQKRNELLRKLFEKRLITNENYKLALLEKIEVFTDAFPKYANHLSDYMNKTQTSKTIHTSIDLSMQKKFERLAKNYGSELSALGIKNLAFLITETKTGKVRTYIGSQNYWDLNNSGMVDGVLSNRSSGSILKPFLYLFSIESGELLPTSQIKDIPVYFNGFSPRNASERFSGMVNLETALIHSLNIPSVIVLQKYGVYPFYQKLKNLGVSSFFRTADEYGLSLILGGSEVNIWDISKLYLSLANLGIKKDLLIFENETSGAKRVFDPISSKYILDMMKNLKRPGAQYYWNRFDSSWPLAWKTGTSYGQKDAWAIGVSPDWTISVWVGNFTGDGNPNLAGAKSAGPLLFNIFNRLEKQTNWFIETADSTTLYKVCSKSGYLVNRDCPDFEYISLSESSTSFPQCKWHKRYVMTRNEKELLCSSCWGTDKKEIVKYVLESNISYYLKKRGESVYQLPKHRKSCQNVVNEKLSFLYPESHSKIAIPRDFNNKKMKIVTKISSNNSSKTFYWYINNLYLGESNSPEYTLSCSPGSYTITVVDNNGNRAKQFFSVL
jgi:penicillin-binding protein 1C